MGSIFKFRFTLLTLPEKGLFSDKTTKYQLPCALPLQSLICIIIISYYYYNIYIYIIVIIIIIYIFKKYKTFSVLIYSYYINTSGNWKNEKLCGNTTPAGRSVHTQFRVFPIFTSKYSTNYNIAQRTLTEEWQEIFRVDIELYQHGS